MFEFSFKLTGTGWAEARVADADAGTHVILTASYLSDALGELVEAVAAVTEGADGSRCSWEEEPGEFRWLFRRDGDQLSVAILAFDDQVDRLADDKGRLILSTTRPVGEVARAIQQAARALLADPRKDEYERQWLMHPFPTEALDRLDRAVDELGRGDG